MVTKKSNYGWCVVVSLCVLIIGTAAHAAGLFDGSKPMLCSSIEGFQCSIKGCEEVLAAEVNLPQFFNIDTEQKNVTGKLENGNQVVSKIEHEEHQDENMVLTGSENGMGWSITVNKQSGKSVLSVSGLDVGFTVFGACTLLD